MNKVNPVEPQRRAGHVKAVLLALLVTFLWSTSWVLIKLGLKANLPAVSFAGLRYTLAFLFLLPLLLFNPGHRQTVRGLTRVQWGQMVLLGLLLYTLTQGAQYVGLAYLPAAMLSLLLNLTPLLVAVISGRTRVEAAPLSQWAGIFLSTVGTLVFFLPFAVPAGQWIGLAAALVCLAANAAASIFGRRINLHSGLSPLVITTLSMGVGGLAMLAIGGLTQGFGRLDFTQWLIVVWLALINTALGFTLWNHTLRTLTAVESSILNSAMMPQIAILAWVFLGEALTVRQMIGMLLVVAGTLIVQLRLRLPQKIRSSGSVEPGQ
ncbi:MAG: DMT family transporter [Anaerolineaceae bacterium]